MAERAIAVFDSVRPPAADASLLGPPVDFDVRGLGCQMLRTGTPEGWIRKIERRREGKVWVGFFHLWTTDANGRRARTKKEKTLGPASMPKHEAQQKLAEYIEEYTGRLTKQGNSITTFTDLWKAFSAVKSGRWSKKMREDLRYLFGKHVLPIVGNQAPRDVTLTSLQLLLNKMAEDGYCKSAVGQIRTYIKACFEYATDEDLIEKNPARKLVMPNIRKKPCERFLSVDELRGLLSQASPREHVVLRILAVWRLAASRDPRVADRGFRRDSTPNRRGSEGAPKGPGPDWHHKDGGERQLRSRPARSRSGDCNMDCRTS
jgi:hypothetical protein